MEWEAIIGPAKENFIRKGTKEAAETNRTSFHGI
jgi:hypothetical protein